MCLLSVGSLTHLQSEASVPHWATGRSRGVKHTTVLAELQARPEGPPSRGSLIMTRSGKPWAHPTAPTGRGAEPVLQLLPQAVIDADGLL